MTKRIFDLAVVLLFAPLWVPLLAVTALLVRVKLGSPVLFRQKRPGRSGVIFEIIKFRSMTDARDVSGNLLPDAQRLPPFGQWLRSSSLDELPELLNVLRGEMSLVGPRPLRVDYLPRYNTRQARRHEVLPGITGLAQVMGRNSITWEEKFEWDVKYVESRGLWVDIRILFRTAKAVLWRSGISAAGEATMPEFNPGATRSNPSREAVHS